MKKILVTGASGFIGSFIIEEALNKGMDTWAGIRKSSSLKYLQNPLIHLLELDFSNNTIFKEQWRAIKQNVGKFDYIVHCAGATKCIRQEDFNRINFQQTQLFVDTLIELDMVPEQFIFVSTLSIFGPIHETDCSEIKESDKPQPNTAYGKSKLMAEEYIASLPNFPYVFLRPTGVYGPRERDYFLMAKSIKGHLDSMVGFKRQDLTFVYVKDIVQAIFLTIDKGITRRAYFLTDGEVYQSTDFSNLIIQELGHPFVIRIRFPLFILKSVSLLAEFLGKCRGKSSTLNSDKYRIMKQRNWRCDITPTKEELGYEPQYKLSRGVKETIDWYKKEKWL